MQNIKHVGRAIDTGRKCLIAYRTIPNDAYNCLIIPTDKLEGEQHDSLIGIVESNAGQSAYELAEVLARNLFSDGSNMLSSLHRRGLLVKMPTDKIEMIPNTQSRINLAELNQNIAEQKGVSVQDLALQDSTKVVTSSKELPPVQDDQATNSDKQLSPEDLAKKYRSEADKLSKQAAELRRKADDLIPTKRVLKSK